MSDSSLFTTGTGGIRVMAAGSVTVGKFSTTGSAGITAMSGSILDAGDVAGDDYANVVAGSARLVAGQGIGVLGAGVQQFETRVGILSARAGAGGVSVSEADALVVGDVAVSVWRVGVEGAAGPRSFPTSVPYPSRANTAFTPYTTPSSRALLGGGAPVFITNIRELADGRIAFQIGYEFQ